ncbi:hypothetical protein B0H34DRAFT_704960 [Crassisporium funariophilum]|nr:hypothetical protein B0H34DRAFT_704960 [Crassisporium funariophilum]
MQEADEQDTCRICSAPAEHDQPLFHPCKCSGTIRYIHQDCLTTWLAHSKKKNCDVCKHSYSFTKVYAPDMPSSLPPVLLIRRLIQHLFLGILFVLRAIAVATIWLGVLPFVTVWSWRMYFSMGESIAWYISDRPRPLGDSEISSLYNRFRYDVTGPPPKNLLAKFTAHPLWLALSADIFTGQIIASLIVLTFVAVFLLREWISQNARPGVFEDEEVVPEDPPADEPIIVRLRPDIPLPQPQVVPQPETLVEMWQREMDAVREGNENRRPDNELNDNLDPDRWFVQENEPDNQEHNRKKKKKLRARQADISDEERNRLRLPQRVLAADNDQEREHVRRKMFHRRIHVARTTAARRRVYTTHKASPSTTPLASQSEGNKFDFTFKAPGAPSVPAVNGNAPSHVMDESPIADVVPRRWNDSLENDDRKRMPPPPPSDSPFPHVALQPPSAEIPFSLRRWPQPSPDQSSASPISPPSYPPRPPLPITFDPPRSRPESPFVFSPGKTPIESPSLATYRAPEELGPEAGPSNTSGYFDKREGEDSEDEIEEEEEDDNLEELDIDIDDDDVFEVDLPEEGVLLLSEDEDFGAEHGRYFRDPEDENPADVVLETQQAVNESDSDDDTEEEGDNDRRDLGVDAEGRAIEDDDDGMFRDGDEDEEEDQEGGEGLFDDDGQWDEGEVEVDAFGAQGVPGGAPAVPLQGLNQQGDAEAAAGLDMNEEGDGNVEDDMEGAMEAIGMRGPIHGIFQNAGLMIFVLDTAIGLGILIPFTIGKTTALLSLDPQRFLHVMHLPIRAMRIVTDPIVDFVAYILVKLLLPRITHIVQSVLRLCIFFVSNFVGKLLGSTLTGGISKLSVKTYNYSAELIIELSDWIRDDFPADDEIPLSYKKPVKTSSFIASIPDMLGFTEPYFAKLGMEIRLLATKLQFTWVRLALGSGPTDRVFAVFLGYVVVAFIFCLYLNILTVGNAKTAGLAVRNAVRQQLLVLKVATFIFIELVTFPLGCGIVLDLCTVWLFPEANMNSRAAFFVQAPLTAMFYHWVAGTMFMYSFAVLLSGCRSVMRPGAMWFIKDPQDQNSHPIRDILDRPTFTQLRKICVSGVMYSFVVACVVGSVAGLLVIGHKSIMPFRWKNREPLSNVPIDLLFLHLVLPYTMHYFRPKRVIKSVATTVWKFLATRLRLTSYFFGGRYPREECTPKNWRDNFVRGGVDVLDEGDAIDGTFRRVPATDNLALPRDMRATAAVTAEGEPVDEAAAALMALQNAEAEKAKRVVKDDYMIVYIPPHFRWRIIGFITLLWIFGAILLGFGVALPIQLGRSFFQLFTSREVHDGYSFILGFYLQWICYLIARAIDRLDKRRQRRGGDGPRGNLHILVVKRGLLWVAKTAYMVFFLGVVVPILLALVIDLYIILPIRFTLDPTLTPRIRIVDSWALGLLYAKIAFHAHRIQPPNRITRGLQHIIAHGWTRPDPIAATKEVIGPLAGGLLGMILFPGIVFRTLQHFFPQLPLDNRFIFMQVYPTVFIFAGTIRSAVVLFDLLSSWSQAIRDKEFLVEMRLRNHEPEKVDATKSAAGAAAGVKEGAGRDDEIRLPPLDLAMEDVERE